MTALAAKDLVEFVDLRDGRGDEQKDGGELAFSFRFRGVLFAGQAESEVDGGRMRIHANLGALPYSLESRYRRENALAIVTAASQALGGRMRVTPEQRILLMDDRNLDEPLSPRALMNNVVRLVLEAKPFIELLSVVVEPPLLNAETPATT